MARHRSRANRRARGRGRRVGFGAAAALLLFGMVPSAPPAQADVVDEVIDEILSPFLDPVTSSIDWDALVSPTAWDTFLEPAHWDVVLADLAAADLSTWFQQSVYTPLHTGVEDWIHSAFGARVDGFINRALDPLTNGQMVIGDGAPGTSAHPDGAAGGLWVGDGGAGWTPPQAGGTPSSTAGEAGGAGGAAGIFGNGGPGGGGGAGAAGGAGGDGGSVMGLGGAGGAGGAGVDGGAGGDGGSATGLFGSGGDGGDGGNSGIGGAATGLPALGGAGGNSGILGDHGAVGHYGTDVGAATHTANADGLPLTTTGSWLTDADGRVVILHGLNQVYKIPPYEPSADGFGDKDAAFLAANGFNVVRVGVIWAGVEPAPGVFNDAYLASIAQTVQTLANHHIVSLLDMAQDLYSSTFGGEGAPAWATQTGGLPNPDFGFPFNYYLNPAELNAWSAFFSNAKAPDGVGLENSYAQMWEHVANYFNGNPDIAGFEIMDEPWAGFSYPSIPFGDPFFAAQQLTPFFNQVDSAIRAVDPTTPVWLEPNLIFESGVSPINLGTVHDPHTVFGFEDYCPQSEFFAISLGCSLFDGVVMDRAAAYATSHHIPAFLEEFGSIDNDTSIADMMRAADQHQIGWTEWAYTGHDITSTSSSGQALVYNPALPPVGANVDTAKLATLAAPYPQAVAGTPNSWSFANSTFQLGYSTERADGGGSFAAGSQTDISVPAIEYPTGYQVSVTGGSVVSAPDAPVLVIASDGGATTVNVVVSPAAARG